MSLILAPSPTPNTFHEAAIVIRPEQSGAYSIWRRDKQISVGTAGAARMVAVGAYFSKLTVYDEETDSYLAGALNQLMAGGRIDGHIKGAQ
jgi:hypothetical protein